MTSLATDVAAISGAAGEKKNARELSKAELRREVEAMSDAMVREQGLLNHAQAAIVFRLFRRF